MIILNLRSIYALRSKPFMDIRRNWFASSEVGASLVNLSFAEVHT